MPACAPRLAAWRAKRPARRDRARRAPRPPLPPSPPSPLAAVLRDGGLAWHRVVARLLLGVLVLLAQLGAHAHAIGHATELPLARNAPAENGSDNGGGAQLAEFCAECLVLGSLGLGLVAQSGCVPFATASFDRPAPRSAAAAVAAALPPRCRAPPAAP